MLDPFLLYPAVLALAISGGVMVIAGRSSRVDKTMFAGAGAGASLAAFIGGLGLALSGLGDIDGWIDCGAHRPYVGAGACQARHWVGAFVFWTPLVTAVLLAASALCALLAGRVLSARARGTRRAPTNSARKQSDQAE